MKAAASASIQRSLLAERVASGPGAADMGGWMNLEM